MMGDYRPIEESKYCEVWAEADIHFATGLKFIAMGDNTALMRCTKPDCRMKEISSIPYPDNPKIMTKGFSCTCGETGGATFSFHTL